MPETRKVLVLCRDFKSVKYWFDQVLDLYDDCGLVTSFNRKKNKICMAHDYVWYFKSINEDENKYKDLIRGYYKIMNDEILEKEFKERGWNGAK